ncbi:MAG: MATE family efflux transporter [Clostridia bacterium]|nr:MATE family efflux transporter [Clostridia bacterium]
MNNSSLDMTRGPLAHQILVFSVPLMFSYVMQVLFNMADVAVVGRFAGPAALGSVGSTVILVSLFTGFLIGIGSGVNVIVARFLGAEMERDVRETVHTSALVCPIIGLLLLIVGVVFSRGILEIMGTKEELIDGTALYLRIVFLGMPALAVYNFGNAVLSAMGDTRRPLLFLTIAGVLNLALNLFFVIACKMDVAGVALATIISQYVSAALIVAALLREKTAVCLKPRLLRLTPKKARMVLAIGVPSGCQNAIFALANLFIQAGVNTFDAVMVEGNAAAGNADGLIYDVMAAFYGACASFMSQNYGARKRDRVLKSYFISLAYSFGAGAVLGGLLLIFGRQFLSLFTTEPAVVAAGMNRLGIMGFSYAFSAFMDCAISASRALGKSVVPMVFVFLGSCVFRVIWVYTVFAHFHTIQSLYLLYIFSWTLTALAENIYFFRVYRKQMDALTPLSAS